MSANARTSFSLHKENWKRQQTFGRHCERSEAIHAAAVERMDCFVSDAPRNDGEREENMIRIGAVATALIWTALAVVPASAADKVVLMLNWYVYGEHAPFYYCKAKGVYAAEGIDLEIQEGRGSAATTQAVAAKTADFGYVDVPTM